VAIVETRDIRKHFGEVRAVDGVSIATRDREFLVLLGPSGCGKTTLLRMIAGLERPTSGDVLIGDRVVTELSPRERKTAMVFQSYALYPHMTVFKNIAFPLKAQGFPGGDIGRKVEWAAQMFGIEKLLDRKPRALSGGERQRVALARAMVRDPSVFLLDEPLSNLDAKLRNSAREELQQFQRRVGTTTIYVTHDQVEAMGLGDRIAVMERGVVRQVGTPQEVYDDPADTFVAGFLGSPPMNLVDGREEIVGFRPENLLPKTIFRNQEGLIPLRFHVTRVENLGADRLIYGTLGDPFTDAKAIANLPYTLPVRIRPGEVHEFALREKNLRFFDRATGHRIPRNPAVERK
jgi:multiple sugar transport system ATP-binding protein